MNRHYVLLATDGYINLPIDDEMMSNNKRRVYVYGFTGGLYKVYDRNYIEYINNDLDYNDVKNYDYFQSLKGNATVPSPLIWGEVDDKIYVTIINLGCKYSDSRNLDVVNFHGGDLPTQHDGVPEFNSGVEIWKDTNRKPPVVTYSFNLRDPGTYMYNCDVNPSTQMQMGMYGGIVVYPSYESLRMNGIRQDIQGRWIANDQYYGIIPRMATNRNFAYNSINSYYDKEYILLLSDLDTSWHDSIEKGKEYNPLDYKPDYWLINGRAYPDTLLIHPATINQDNNVELTQVSYESYIHVNDGELLLLRVINMSCQMVPWHTQGNHFYTIGKDALPSPFLAVSQLIDRKSSKISVFDLFERGFTAKIAPGESYDLLISAEGRKSNYIYPQYYFLYNNENYKVTNNGKYPGGQLTFMQIDE